MAAWSAIHEAHDLEEATDKPVTKTEPLTGRSLRPRRVLGQAGGGRGGPADPLVLPCLVELLVVAPGLVDRGQLPGDLLPVRPAAARDLVGADVDLPPGSGALDPAVCARVLE